MPGLWIDEHVLWLDVAMRDPLTVQIRKPSEHLERKEPHVEHWREFPVLAVLHDKLVERGREVVHDYVQIDLVGCFPGRFERVLQRNAVLVVEELEDVKFSVFVVRVLQNLFDCDKASVLRSCAVDNTEGTLAKHFDGFVILAGACSRACQKWFPGGRLGTSR